MSVTPLLAPLMLRLRVTCQNTDGCATSAERTFSLGFEALVAIVAGCVNMWPIDLSFFLAP